MQKLGFYTTRFIEAKNREAAEKQALNLLRKELRSVVLNEKSNPPMMYIEETVEIRSFEDRLVPGRGFSWYPEKS